MGRQCSIDSPHECPLRRDNLCWCCLGRCATSSSNLLMLSMHSTYISYTKIDAMVLHGGYAQTAGVAYPGGLALGHGATLLVRSSTILGFLHEQNHILF